MSEVNYDDLDELQKQALIDAFGEPSEYETPLFSEADVTEVAEYSNLRTKLEGLNVERGNIDSERLDYFTGENGNILKETDEGEYEVNSIWDSWMLEEMEEKDMIDSSQFSFYKAENLEDTDMSVLELGGSFYLDIEDGVTFSLGSAETVEDAEYDSAEKVQHMTEEFIKQFACGEGEEPGDTGYINDISSKPEGNSTRINGGENMEDYEEIEQELSDLKDVTQEFYELTDRAESNAADAESVVDQVKAVEGMVDSALDSYRDVKNEYDDAVDQIDEMDKIVEGIYRTIDTATSKLGSIYDDLDEKISDTDDSLNQAYNKLESIAETNTPTFSPDPRVREVADKVDATDPDRFDEIEEQFENIGTSE